MNSEQLIDLAEKIAPNLLRPATLHRMGYRRATNEIIITFDVAIRIINTFSVQCAIRKLEIWPEMETEWEKHKFLRNLGEHLRKHGFDLTQKELAYLVGYLKRAYVGLMPYWRFQKHPVSIGWGTHALKLMHYETLLPEQSTNIPSGPLAHLAIPDGWKMASLFLESNRCWCVITPKENEGDILPPLTEEWVMIYPDEQWSVVIYPPTTHPDTEALSMWMPSGNSAV